MNKTELLETIREFTRDGYTFSIMSLSEKEYSFVRQLESEGKIIHAAFDENWNGAKMGYIAK
jgi:hypothetical protein